MKDIIFLRTNGEESENVILSGGFDKTSGEQIFFELIGYSGEVNKLLINGKEKYKRLFIQRVYPYKIV